MNEAKGSFTVEAVLLLPFLITISVVLIYYSIYVYDKTLMFQDTQSIAVYFRNGDLGSNGEEVECVRDEIIEQHPYLSVNNMEIEVEKKNIKFESDWRLPIWEKFDSKLQTKVKIVKTDPINMMYRTEQLQEIVGGFD